MYQHEGPSITRKKIKWISQRQIDLRSHADILRRYTRLSDLFTRAPKASQLGLAGAFARGDQTEGTGGTKDHKDYQ